jgi:hypothetical protein
MTLRDDIPIIVKGSINAYSNWLYVLYKFARVNLNYPSDGDLSKIQIKVKSRKLGTINVPINVAIINAMLKYENKYGKTAIFDNKNEIGFEYKGNNITLKLHKILERGIYENFVYEQYWYLANFLATEKENTVVDIGAGIGDSPIYFTMNGAKKVIAIESDKERCDLLKDNVKANGFEGKIIPVYGGYNNISLKKIGEIVKNETGDERYFLKMDCEGCEYNLLKENRKDLAKIKHFQIEFHYGYESLEKFMSDNGFDIHYFTYDRMGVFGHDRFKFYIPHKKEKKRDGTVMDVGMLSGSSK